MSQIRSHIPTFIIAPVSAPTDTTSTICRNFVPTLSDHVVSAATGHQRSDGRGQINKGYMASRSAKLRNQLPERLDGPEGIILRGVRIYINGYLENTTDIEMKRNVTLAGGQIL